MTQELPVEAADGHRWRMLVRSPAQPRAALLWLPALGVAARHYLPFAEALAPHGIASFLHEWRGHGSSNLRAGHDVDWGYRELLALDLPAAETVMQGALPANTRRIVGGHSLGGQLAACRLAIAPVSACALWLVASGAPYWRAFPSPQRYALPLAYRFLPWLARHCGALPGHRIGFGRKEARRLIDDWARSALSGRYAAPGLETDLDASLAGIHCPIRAVVLDEDWLAPESSLRFLLSKMPCADATMARLGRDGLGTRTDHFAWMKRPAAVAAALAE